MCRMSPLQRTPCRAKTVFALEMDWVAWDSRGLTGVLRVFDPEGVLTWERSWTSIGGGLELGDSPEAKSQSSQVEKGDPKRRGLSTWWGGGNPPGGGGSTPPGFGQQDDVFHAPIVGFFANTGSHIELN